MDGDLDMKIANIIGFASLHHADGINSVSH